MKTTSKLADRISESVHYEAYFDLYGLPVAWIESIQSALHEYAQPSLGDECETYCCEAAMAARFTSTDAARVQVAKRIAGRLFNLAAPTLSNRRAYELRCA